MPGFTEDKIFTANDYKKIEFYKTSFENCSFNNCDLSESDFSEAGFIDCTFNDCNLSLVKLSDTIFRDVKFTGCKMLGLLFEDCNKYGVAFSFDNCVLNNASFYKTKIARTIFNACQLQEVDFSECDAAAAVFNNCNLLNAKFENTILEKADLRTAYNYSINPEKNKIKKARFSLPAVTGLLHQYNIIIE